MNDFWKDFWNDVEMSLGELISNDLVSKELQESRNRYGWADDGQKEALMHFGPEKLAKEIIAKFRREQKQINKWRITLDDPRDGNVIFQCLACKNYIQSWGYPQVRNDGSLSSGYQFCPYCGVLWEGEHEWGYDNVKSLDTPEREASIVWAIQEITVFEQPDGSYKQLARVVSVNEAQERWEPVWIWKTLSFYPNASAHQIYNALKLNRTYYEKGSFPDIKNIVRAVVVKPGIPLWEEYKKRHHSYYSNFGYRFWEEYVKQWGGKMHWSEKERDWIL